MQFSYSGPCHWRLESHERPDSDRVIVDHASEAQVSHAALHDTAFSIARGSLPSEFERILPVQKSVLQCKSNQSAFGSLANKLVV